MKFKKIVIGVVGIAVILALAGLASAAEVEIDPHEISLILDNATVSNGTVQVEHIDYKNKGSTHTRHISVETDNQNLWARVVNPSLGVNTGWTNNVLVGDNYTASSPNDYKFTLEVKGNSTGTITVYDNAGTEWSPRAGKDFAAATVPAIPEFPSVAIALAITLGIGFMMYKRKFK
ncbi:MAG: hypothetical protein ACE5KT_09425 [Methanosarcinales archaeon]